MIVGIPWIIQILTIVANFYVKVNKFWNIETFTGRSSRQKIALY